MLVEAGSLFVQKNLPEQGFLIGHGTQWIINSLKFCVKLYLYVQMRFSKRESIAFCRPSKGYVIKKIRVGRKSP